MKKIDINVNKRKTWLFIAISLFSALSIMLLYYVQWCPKSDVSLHFESHGQVNSASQGNEFRIYYIMVDDEFIALAPYAANGWQYDGTLVCYGNNTLDISVPANRVIEVSLKKGPYMGGGFIRVGETQQNVDLYHEQDDVAQQVIKSEINQFFEPSTLIIGFIAFLITFAALIFTMDKKVPSFFNEDLTLRDIFVSTVVAGLPLAVSLTLIIFPGNREIFAHMDASAYAVEAKMLLGGQQLYSFIIDQKGPIFFYWLALGELIWMPYGIYFIELLTIFIGSLFLYLSLRLLFPRYISLIALVFAFCVGHSVYLEGTSTESFSTPLSCVALYVFIRALKNEGNIGKRWLIICGILFGAAAASRPTNAYLWVAGVPVLLAYQFMKKEWLKALKQLLLMGAGVAIISLPWIIHFLASGTLGIWYETTIEFASGYYGSGSARIPLVNRIMTGVDMLSATQIKYLWHVTAVAIAHNVIVFFTEKNDSAKKWIAVLFGGASVAGIIFSTWSGFNFPHYVIVLYPMFALMAAFAAEAVSKVLGGPGSYYRTRIVLGVLLCVSVAFPIRYWTSGYPDRQEFPLGSDLYNSLAMSNIIQSYTEDGATVLLYDAPKSYEISMTQHMLTDRFIDIGATVLDQLPEVGQRSLNRKNPYLIRNINYSHPVIDDYVNTYYSQIYAVGNHILYEYQPE